MKTNWIARKQGSLLPLIMAAIFTLTTFGCNEGELIDYEESSSPDARSSDNIMNETFWVNPEGSNIVLFDGIVSLEFPEGAVSASTQFTLVSFPLDHLDLDGHNYYNRGYSLSGITAYQKLNTANTKINIKYDLEEGSWLKGVPTDPGNLTILNVSPTVYSYDRVVSIGNCCTDFSCKIIKGCICQCGFYVVGEN